MPVRTLALVLATTVLALGCSSENTPARATPVKPTAAASPAGANAVTSEPPSTGPHPGIHWTTLDKGANKAGTLEAAAGKASGVPVVYVGATWCGPCKVYKSTLTDPRMVAAHKGAHIIEVDLDVHPKALQSVGIQPAGVPHWEMLDSSGQRVGRTIDGGHWDDNTVENMAPALTQFFGVKSAG